MYDTLGEIDPFGLINFKNLTDVVSDKYPNINKVSAMNPPKSTDMEVPKLCR